MKSASKLRLDSLLVERGFFDSREKAQKAILAGGVVINDQVADKAGTRYANDVPIEVRLKERYVSRGGLKLEAALQTFPVDTLGAVCLDLGASTGGFTDCLLQHGAARVYAYDVGHSQLDWKIRSDPRVVTREKINARYLKPTDIPEPIALCVIDVSFIGLSLILPPACAIVSPANISTNSEKKTVMALIKPQFELERGAVGKGGIVREPRDHERAVEKVRGFVAENLSDWHWTGVIDSPILGTNGNKEFFACLQK